MTEEEWIEKYRDEIWMPLDNCKGQTLRTDRFDYSICEPVRLIDYKTFVVQWTDSPFRVLDIGEFRKCFMKLSQQDGQKKKQSKDIVLFREMFIPDDYFISGRLCVGTICVNKTDNGYGVIYRSSPFSWDYIDNNFTAGTDRLMHEKWTGCVKKACNNYSEDHSTALAGLPDSDGGTYLSPVLSVDIPGSFNDLSAITEWQSVYFENANKRIKERVEA